jgi:transposase
MDQLVWHWVGLVTGPIDKSLPTAGLLARVMMARFADHLPLYRLDGLLG